MCISCCICCRQPIAVSPPVYHSSLIKSAPLPPKAATTLISEIATVAVKNKGSEQPHELPTPFGHFLSHSFRQLPFPHDLILNTLLSNHSPQPLSAIRQPLTVPVRSRVRLFLPTLIVRPLVPRPRQRRKRKRWGSHVWAVKGREKHIETTAVTPFYYVLQCGTVHEPLLESLIIFLDSDMAAISHGSVNHGLTFG